MQPCCCHKLSTCCHFYLHTYNFRGVGNLPTCTQKWTAAGEQHWDPSEWDRPGECGRWYTTQNSCIGTKIRAKWPASGWLLEEVATYRLEQVCRININDYYLKWTRAYIALRYRPTETLSNIRMNTTYIDIVSTDIVVLITLSISWAIPSSLQAKSVMAAVWMSHLHDT